MSTLKNYAPMDLDAQDELDKEFDKGGNEFCKLKVGKNVFRCLPRKPDQKSNIVVIHEHFVDDVPGMEGKTFRFACPRRHANQRCPECEKADRMRKSDNPVDRQSAKDHYPTTRAYMNVIDRRDEDAGPKILTFGKSIRTQLKAIEGDQADGGDYTNPLDEGFDIVIKRVGTGQYDTEYTVSAARNNSPLADDEDESEEWIEGQWRLDNYKDVMDPQKLLAALKGEQYSRQALPAGRVKGRRTAQDDVGD